MLKSFLELELKGAAELVIIPLAASLIVYIDHIYRKSISISPKFLGVKFAATHNINVSICTTLNAVQVAFSSIQVNSYK